MLAKTITLEIVAREIRDKYGCFVTMNPFHHFMILKFEGETYRWADPNLTFGFAGYIEIEGRPETREYVRTVLTPMTVRLACEVFMGTIARMKAANKI